LSTFFRWLCEALVALYFPGRSLANRERLPKSGRVILVANHPNGLLDPIVLRIITGVRARFLAKSTLFSNALWRFAMGSFGVIPVFRKQDAAQGEDTRDGNERTFALCRQALAAREALALFPEGVSHADAHIQPLKTGAARIALSSDAELGAVSELTIVPVGLEYEARSIFRSRVLAVVGEPIDVQAFRAQYAADPRAAVDALTAVIAERLHGLVVQASTRAVLDGVARVAVWTGDPALRDDLDARHARAQTLADALATLEARDPAQAEEIVREVREYDRILRALGVQDPWGLEVGRVRLGTAVRVAIELAVMAPLALVGALLSWVPYRLVRVVAHRYTQNEDVLGSVKLLGGMIFVGLTWVVQALVALFVLGPWYALAFALLAPLTGYFALRFDEELSLALAALRHGWIRTSRPLLVARLADRRRALADAVAQALDRVEK
jgi:1-acyl-sn-glycerol-3-phosphate acyltransferase